jgi:carbonic anhydrase
MKYRSCRLTVAAAVLTLCLTACTTTRESAPSKLSPAEALARLQAGNERFVAGKLQHPHQTPQRRAELATTQRPFAIVLGCADSRTSPEVLFDQGLGDIFVVRVAGNVLNDELVGSMEYGVDQLGVPLIIVLGHQRCGAVKAAKEMIAAKVEPPGHLPSLVKALQPAVDATIGKSAEDTALTNVLYMVQTLRDCAPVLKPAIAAGKVSVVGAFYDFDTGTVEFLKDGRDAR